MGSKLKYDIIDVKNSIAVIKWDDGTLCHVQTSSLSELLLKEYWEAKARATREYFDNKQEK